MSAPAHRLHAVPLPETKQGTSDSPHFAVPYDCEHQACMHTHAFSFTSSIVSLTFAVPYLYRQRSCSPTARDSTTKNKRKTHQIVHILRSPPTASNKTVCALTTFLLQRPKCRSLLQFRTYTVSLAAPRLQSNLPPKTKRNKSYSPELVVPSDCQQKTCISTQHFSSTPL